MGLRIREDLAAWHEWQARRHRLRHLRAHLSRSNAHEPPLELWRGSDDADILVALDAGHASVAAALRRPLRHVDPTRLAILAPQGLAFDPPSAEGFTRPVTSQIDSLNIRAVLAGGHYTAPGAAAYRFARSRSIPFYVSQHGALTPFAPPLPANARLLAWSDDDADFWRSGRSDVDHEVVGSQLLWQTGQLPVSSADSSFQPDGSLTYLGQMHAAELPRGRLVRSAAAFCRANGATYRPHPSELDKLSRLTHAAYRRAGILIDGSTPLAALGGPVVSVFSTGVLEAATQGRDAWVHFPRPPAWLEEFWERYGMRRFGDIPTPAPARPAVEPAQRIASILTEAVS